MSKYFPRCIFLEMGFLCPACGGTRCVYNIASGNFLKAFTLNPFIFLLVLYVILVVMLLNINYLFNVSFLKKTLAAMVHYKAVIVIAVLYALFGIVRNM